LFFAQKFGDVSHVFAEGKFLGIVILTGAALSAIRGSFSLKPVGVVLAVDFVKTTCFLGKRHPHSVPHLGIEMDLNLFRTVLETL
jgi:hypothetical protein